MTPPVSMRKAPPFTMRRWYGLLAICLSMVALVAICIAYTSYVDRRREAAERTADRRWCSLMTTLDSAYQAAPPTSEAGRKVAAEIHQLVISLECKD